MDIVEQKKAAEQFVADWTDRGDEKQDTQNYWNQLLRTVYGVSVPEQYIAYEKPVAKGFIDGYIADTRVLIEQKGMAFDLDVKEPRQGRMVTPYEQARDYVSQLSLSEKPRYIITCNFQKIRIYDCDIQPSYNRKTDTWYAPFEEIELKDLATEYRRLNFLVNVEDQNIKKEMEISIQAGDLVGIIYDELLKQYKDPDDPETQKSLNQLCVRFVFCFYAEDADIFGKPAMFHDYLQAHRSEARQALIRLFKILDTRPEDRDPYDDEDLLAFPYVNGGLFENEDIIIPRLTPEIVDLILEKASENFDWSKISPTIFGAVFESTLNPETRRSGGMHYTSIENIHKVIDPLFLDELKLELDEILKETVVKTKQRKLKEYQDKLATIVCLDPAAGSGNFLTESYLSLRRLENRVLQELQGGQMTFADTSASSVIKVSIGQFYGIEINDFAVTVARTALWIAENQMLQETENILFLHLDFLPLKSYPNIHEGNALRLNWEDVVAKDRVKYIMGNPPFSGTKWMGASQKDDTKLVLGKWDKYGTLDYVACWYKLASEFIQGTTIRCAFVSTNSICQGEQVCNLWKPLFEDYGIIIDYAYRTFIWDSEASIKAHVHCIIVGFSVANNIREKHIYDSDRVIVANNINAYLANAENTFIESRKEPISDVPEIHQGCKFVDGLNLIFEEDEKEKLLKEEPLSGQFIRPFMMGKDFIDQKPRYCLWLKGADPALLKKCPQILERVERVREFRAASSSPDTKKYVDTPTLPARMAYYSDDQNVDYIAIPKVSSQRRRYVPMGLLKKEIVSGDKVYIMPYATLYHFGILESNVHMAWLRAVCGRLKSDYSYSNTIVYNNFPWPVPSDSQRNLIEKTAQEILDARALYPNSSLADLYDPLTMPPELLKAHAANDRAVLDAYGFKGTPAYTSEAACVAELMKMYQSMVKKNA